MVYITEVLIVVTSFRFVNSFIQIDSKFSQHTKHKSKNIAPLNFATYTSTFTPCLLQVVNFHGVNFPNVSPIPWVLTRMNIVEVKLSNNPSQYKKYLVPFEKYLKLKSNFSHTITDWSNISFNSSALKLSRIVMNSKPWYCEAHIQLFPPKISDKLYYDKQFGNTYNILTKLSTKFWKNHDSKNLQFYTQIETRWRYEILVSKVSVDSTIQSWINGVIVFPYVYMEPAIATKELLHWSVERDMIIDVFHLCHFCVPNTTFSKILLKLKYSVSLNLLNEWFEAANKNANNIVWKISGFYPRQQTGKFLPFPKRGSMTFIHLDNLYLFLSRSSDILHRYTDQHLLYDIFGNATYERSDALNSNKFDLAVYPNVILFEEDSTFPTYFPVHTKKWLFVACGQINGETHFQELISSYDSDSWYCIIILLIIFVPAILTIMEAISGHYICKSEFKFQFYRGINFNISSIFKCFVNYANSSFNSLIDKYTFRDNKYFPFTFRFVTGVVMLVGIILSNGYKGKNITKIISPISDIPFTLFDQLVKNKLKIYSFPMRSIKLDFSIEQVLNYVKNQSNIISRPGMHCFKINITFLDVNITAAVQITSALRQIFSGWMQKDDTNMDFSNKNCDKNWNFGKRANFILNHTSFIKPPWENYYDFSISPYHHFRNCSKMGKVAMIDSEEKILTLKAWYNKEYEKYDGSISFGKEVIASKTESFIWQGWIPPIVLRRMKGLYFSGIAMWHDEMRLKQYKTLGLLADFPIRAVFKPSNLQGSIRIIFIVFPLGFLAAFVCFVLEARRKYVSVVLVIYEKFRTIRNKLCKNTKIVIPK